MTCSDRNTCELYVSFTMFYGETYLCEYDYNKYIVYYMYIIFKEMYPRPRSNALLKT